MICKVCGKKFEKGDKAVPYTWPGILVWKNGDGLAHPKCQKERKKYLVWLRDTRPGPARQNRRLLMKFYTEKEIQNQGQELGRDFWKRGCLVCGKQVAAARVLKLIPKHPGALLDEFGITSNDPVSAHLPVCAECLDVDIEILINSLKMEKDRDNGNTTAS